MRVAQAVGQRLVHADYDAANGRIGPVAIEHPVPALGLDDGGAMLEALPRVERRGLRLRISLREQQGIRYVVARPA